MSDLDEYLEKLWGDLLSRKARQVRSAFASLPPTQQASVIAHLNNMLTAEGWQVEQRRSARAALKALGYPLPPKFQP